MVPLVLPDEYRYFWTHGPWMTNVLFAVQALVVVATGIVLAVVLAVGTKKGVLPPDEKHERESAVEQGSDGTRFWARFLPKLR